MDNLIHKLNKLIVRHRETSLLRFLRQFTLLRAAWFVFYKVSLLVRARIRYFWLTGRGYKIVNPLENEFVMAPARNCEKALQNIFIKIGKNHFKNAIELGCDRGTHYSNMLKKYCDCLIGVDVLEEQDVKNLNKYIRVDPTGNIENVLWEIPDKSIDCVFIINFTGMGVNGDWDSQLVMDNSRAGNYFFENNFGRVLRSGGFVVWIEWEAYPEKHFGKLRLSDIETKINSFYHHSEIPGFKYILKGFSATHMGPYIVYQRRHG